MSPRPGVLVLGGLLAVGIAGWLAVVEVLWLPLRIGGVLVPVSVLAAVLGNLLLPALALRLTGSRAVAVLPCLTWLTVAIAATVRRPEGDQLMIGGSGDAGVLSLAFLLIGVLAAAVAAGRVLAAPRGRAGGPAPGRARPAAGA